MFIVQLKNKEKNRGAILKRKNEVLENIRGFNDRQNRDTTEYKAPPSEVSGSEFIMIMKIMGSESISGNAVIKSKITAVVRERLKNGY